ncbi:MAG TPA: MFS transporter [Acidimicrobiales bacterium]|nr:MFS transporter [Acidimicrobiales bacterium]
MLLAAVMGLQSADSGVVGSVAPQLESTFHIGTTQLGLLVTVSSVVGALASLPFGVLVDRRRRVPLLAAAVATWALAMVATGLSTSYLMLLVGRLGLGAVSAVSGPATASLAGDLFAPGERSRIYGVILTGDLLGAGAGLLVAGDIGAALTWRAAFLVLAVPSAALALALRRLPEPERGAQTAAPADGRHQAGADAALRAQVRARPDVHPSDGVVVDDPATVTGLRRATVYVLRIASNRALIAASALGYFFLGGLRVFAIVFARGHWSLSTGTVNLLLVVIGAGGVAGTVLGGRLADRLIGRGRPDGRLLVGGCAFIAAGVLFVPGLRSSDLAVSLPLLLVAAGCLSASNPALDAARLDVVPSTLWGRAESVRGVARTLLEAAAPLLFGYVAALLGATGGVSAGAGAGGSGTSAGPASAQTAGALGLTFLVMLAPFAASGVVLLARRRAYLADVAAADRSQQRIDRDLAAR